MGNLEARPVEEGQRRRVLQALRKSRGRVTVGDVVTATGLAREEAEGTLRSLLGTHEGHLEVSEDGDLIYLFDPSLVRRDERGAWERFQDAAWRAFKAGFKVWIMVMLVAYFVIYVTLAIAAFVALMSQNRNSSSSSRRGPNIPIFWLFYIFWTPDWRYGSGYYGHSYQQQSRRSSFGQSAPKAPFYKQVFAFVFGPDVLPVDPLERDRKAAELIRAKRGVITVADWVRFSGDSRAKADSELGRILAAFDGEVEISEEGEVLYVFKGLLLSAEGAKVSEPPPAWHRLEVPKSLTGNKSGPNWLIGVFNAFNLVFAVISPSALFPILEISGPVAMVGLVYVPGVFSLLFFAVPALRWVALSRENLRRHERNVRRLVLRAVFASVEGREQIAVPAGAVKEDVVKALRQVKTTGDVAVIDQVWRETTAEFEADIAGVEQGEGGFVFPSLWRAFQEAEKARAALRLDQQKVGAVVFATADSNDEAEARELQAFERELGVAEEEAEVGVGRRHH